MSSSAAALALLALFFQPISEVRAEDSAQDLNKLARQCLKAASRESDAGVAVFAGRAEVAHKGVLQGIYVLDAEGKLKFYGVPAGKRAFACPMGKVKLKFDRAGALAGYEFVTDPRKIERLVSEQKLGLAVATEVAEPSTGAEGDPYRAGFCREFSKIGAQYLSDAKTQLSSMMRVQGGAKEKERSDSIEGRLNELAQKQSMLACNKLWQGHACNTDEQMRACRVEFRRIYEQVYNDELARLTRASSSCVQVGKAWCQPSNAKLSRVFEGFPLPKVKVTAMAENFEITCRNNEVSRVGFKKNPMLFQIESDDRSATDAPPGATGRVAR